MASRAEAGLWQTGGMARGWESKSVEEQIENAQPERKPDRPKQTEEEQRRRRERSDLELLRDRVNQDLARAVHPRRRAQLEAALKHLDQKLAER